MNYLVKVKSLLVLDVETSGVTPSSACIEVAVATFDVCTASVVNTFSSLIRASRNPAYLINGIPESLLKRAPLAESVWSVIRRRAEGCQAITSYNRAFDQRYVPRLSADGIPWFCSCYDVDWPNASRRGVKLSELASDHDVPIGGVHRALADVDILCRLLTKVSMKRDLGSLIDDALVRRATRVAQGVKRATS